MSLATDRRLRLLVLELAAASPDDAQDVISRLEPQQQTLVRELLLSHMGAAQTARTTTNELRAPLDVAVATPSLDGLSPWIVDRFLADGGKEWRVTPQALAALRRAVDAVQPTQVPAEPQAEPARSAVDWWRRLVRSRTAGSSS